MYKIDKKRIMSAVFGSLLSLNILGCSYTTTDNVQDDSYYVETDNYHHYLGTALFFDGNTAILIPYDGIQAKSGGFLSINYGNYHYVTFSSSDIALFEDYNDALNYALSLTNTIYNYEDVVNGNYDNIALGYNIEREMGITKKKDL